MRILPTFEPQEMHHGHDIYGAPMFHSFAVAILMAIESYHNYVTIHICLIHY
jgi:hypothetical protein